MSVRYAIVVAGILLLQESPSAEVQWGYRASTPIGPTNHSREFSFQGLKSLAVL
jgi:hypothetical protein